ncbi:hypothetical protein [Segatella copri]|uniref:hypothetical protein n=1 Tax=Segatella copri TaxID=165179 RepID=UPI00222E1ABE|nr:hypothetical protein [Segatella copri]MCW4101504.1 hypothetical protein [Segatella copri]
MVSIKTLYFDVGNAMKGICDKLYSLSRPKAVDTKINCYIVVCFPSSIYNNEMNSSGVYNDFTTTAQIELYVRDKASARNPNTFDVSSVDEKVQEIMDKFPISTKNLIVSNPRITLQTDDGAGFSVTIIQGRLRTK